MQYRKTRLVCVSDTHGYSPSEAGFKLPPGDVLIHAGDLTNHGSYRELRRTLEWIDRADYEVKVVVAGNHDITLDQPFYTRHHHDDGNEQEALEKSQKCIELVRECSTASSSIVFLQHESATIRLTRPDGPRTVFKVFGSPYSPRHSTSRDNDNNGSDSGKWAAAFGYEPVPVPLLADGYDNDNDRAVETTPAAEAASKTNTLWDAIPLDADVVITHTPPYSHCDRRPPSRQGQPRDYTVSVGCAALGWALQQRVRPKVAICGHVHESRGCERALWAWSSWPKLCFDTGLSGESEATKAVSSVPLPPPGSKKQSLVDLTGRTAPRLENGLAAGDGWGVSRGRGHYTWRDSGVCDEEGGGGGGCDGDGEGDDGNDSDHAIRAQQSRRETCMVNAAIMGTSWPHSGGKRFNTPIVVDLELPVATGSVP